MQNNKIYMTLAHLYNQVKGVVGDSGNTLSEEINKRVNDSPEVIEARKGYPKLINKVDAIDKSIDGAGQEIMAVSDRINKTADEILRIDGEINIIKETNPIVELENGESMLVEVVKRPSHRTLEFSLKDGEQYRTNADAEHYVSNLYVRDNIHNKEIDLSFHPDESIYNKDKYDNIDGSLYGAYVGEAYISLRDIMTAKQFTDNIAVIPGIAQVQGITTVSDVTEKNHVINAFVQGYKWTMKSRRAEVELLFDRPTDIVKIDFDFKANTQQQSVSVYEYVDGKPKELNKVSSLDKEIAVGKKVQHILVLFDALSDNMATIIDVKDIAIKTKVYNTGDDTFTVARQIDLYDLSGHASLGSIIETPGTSRNVYAISSSKDADLVQTYYPSRRYMRSTSFKNKFGNYSCDTLKAITLNSFILDSRLSDKGVVGNEGAIAIGNSTTWSEDTSVTFADGWQINSLAYVMLQVVVSSTTHSIPLKAVNLNKNTMYEYDGVRFFVQLKVVNGGLKIKVYSEYTLRSIKLVMNCIQNMFSSGNGSYVRPQDGSSTELTYDINERGYTLKNIYNSWKNHYTYSSVYGWEFRYSSYSKYNQTLNHSIVFLDCDRVDGNKFKVSTSKPTQYDQYVFEISDTRNAVAYIGNNSNAFAMRKNDCSIVEANNAPQVSPLNEYIGVMKKHIRQRILKVTPEYTSDRQHDIHIYFSNNNYNFYTYDALTGNWVQTKDGMSPEFLKGIPHYAYDKLFTSEDIYIKVKLEYPTAEVRGFEIEFDRDGSIEYSKDVIKEYGMEADDLGRIDSSFLLNLINKNSTLAVFTTGSSKYAHEKYMSPGLQLIEYGGISWMLDTNETATQHVSGNTLIITNTTNEVRHYKLEQKYFEDKYVQIGSKEENEFVQDLVKENQELIKQVYDYKSQVDILDQNVQLLLRAMDNNEKPPSDLPSFIIPTQIEIDLPELMPGDSTEIRNMKELRYIQYWNTTKQPVPERIENFTVGELQHHFIYKYGTFQPTYFEMEKYYDTDNWYLMTRSFTSITPSSYKTAEYTCTSKYQDGALCAVYGNYGLDRIMAQPRDGTNSYHGDYQMNTMAYFDLPGEARRWVDIDVEFVEPEYIYGLLNMDFNCRGRDNEMNNASSLYGPAQFRSYQNTIIFIDEKGDGDWIEHKRYTGIGTNVNCYIQKEVKKIRIRLEVPYSNDRGKGQVSLKYFDIYYSPIRYRHDEDAIIKPILYYNTTTWKRLLSTFSDATISGTNTDIRYLIETNNEMQNDKKIWGFDGINLVEKNGEIYSNGMTLFAFNNLTEEQLLPLLEYPYIRPIAILDSTDGHHSPQLRSFRMNYSEKDTETVSLVNPGDVNTRYDKEKQSVVVTNATNGIQTLKAIIS